MTSSSQRSSSGAPVLLAYAEALLVRAAALRDGEEAWSDADPGAFRERVEVVLSGLEQQARAQGLDEEAVGATAFAVVAFVDEAVISSLDEPNPQWLAQPLQLERFGDQAAGRRFFERLDALQRRAHPPVEALEVYMACLQLGFQGVYAFERDMDLSALQRELYSHIRILRGAAADERQAVALTRSCPARRRKLPMSLLLLAALGGAVLVAAYLQAAKQVQLAADEAIESLRAAREALDTESL